MSDQPITIDDVRRLDVRPGDVVVLRADRLLSANEVDVIQAELDKVNEAKDLRVHFVILEGGLRVDSILGPSGQPERTTA